MHIKETTLVMACCFVASCGGTEGELPLGIDQEAISVNIANDPYGQVSTFPNAGPIDFSSANPFFASFGTNGRTCGTCHLQEEGWTLTPAHAKAVASANANDPLFAFDGSDCPLPQNGNPTQNSKQLLGKGLIRVDLSIPGNADFFLNGFADPFNCASRPSAARLPAYRRPLPSTNLPFLSTVMWDGRETTQPTIEADLEQQANDATLGHAQAVQALTTSQRQAVFNFENPLFSTQTSLNNGAQVLDLTSGGANGGPGYLGQTVAPAFFLGINDTFSPSFNSTVFTIYAAWEPGSAQFASLSPLQQSIGRGERIFNSRTFTITGVGGINGAHDPSQAPITGTCTTCHNSPNVGNHSSSLPLDIGTNDASSKSPAGKTLDIGILPIYTFVQTGTNQIITVTDPGRGLITGHFADIGKVKGPILRGLAAREPLFHNGSASITTLISFYNLRFNIGLSTQDRADLASFLKAL